MASMKLDGTKIPTLNNMGTEFTDAYSLLHFSVGVIVRHWNISLISWIILHSVFEFLENTNIGMDFINKYITMWPGGKPMPDSFLNNIGDSLYSIIGWVAADYFLNVQQK
jgi:hypothetical protein